MVNSEPEQKTEEAKEAVMTEDEIATLAVTWAEMAFENYDKDKNGVIEIKSEATEFIQFYADLVLE